MKHRKTSNLAQSSTEMAHLRYASADDVHNPLRLFPNHTLKAIYASGVRSRSCLLCNQDIRRAGGLCLLLRTVDCPTRFAQHVSTGGFPARKGGMSCPLPANFLPTQLVKLHAELLKFLHKVLCYRASHFSSVGSATTDG